MLEAGIKGLEEMTVTPDDTAQVYKSGTLQVLATPRLAALMEETAWKSVRLFLEFLFLHNKAFMLCCADFSFFILRRNGKNKLSALRLLRPDWRR